MREEFSRGMWQVAACAVLASCGGGGGGGATPDAGAGSSSNITFSPSSIRVIQNQGTEEYIDLSVTIDPVPEGREFHAAITADQPVVQTGEAWMMVTDDDSATVTIKTERALAVGTHDGHLTLHLCRDFQCKDEVSLTGNVLPYSVKVLPPVQLKVTGEAASGALNEYYVDPGATVVLTSNIPVTWSRGSSVTGTDLRVISSTPRRWEGQILGNSRAFIGVMASSVEKPMGNGEQVIFRIR